VPQALSAAGLFASAFLQSDAKSSSGEPCGLVRMQQVPTSSA
jgi:hypothetical protein